MNTECGMFGQRNESTALHANSSPPPKAPSNKWSAKNPISSVVVFAQKKTIQFILFVQNGKKGKKNYFGPGEDVIEIITNGINELNAVPENIWTKVTMLQLDGRKLDAEIRLIIQKVNGLKTIGILNPPEELKKLMEELAQKYASTLQDLEVSEEMNKKSAEVVVFNLAWLSPFTELRYLDIYFQRNVGAEGVELMPPSLTSFASSLVVSEDHAAWMSQKLVNLHFLFTFIDVPLGSGNGEMNLKTIKRFCNLAKFNLLMLLIVSKGVGKGDKSKELKAQLLPWLELCSGVDGMETSLTTVGEGSLDPKSKDGEKPEPPHYIFSVNIDRKAFKGFH